MNSFEKLTLRINHLRWFVKKGVLKNFANLTGKHLHLKACNFIKKRLQHKCFPVKFAKFLRMLISRTSAKNCFCSSFY